MVEDNYFYCSLGLHRGTYIIMCKGLNLSFLVVYHSTMRRVSSHIHHSAKGFDAVLVCVNTPWKAV